MELYGQQSESIPQKITIHLIEILLLWLSFWILFQSGGSWIESKLAIHNAAAGFGRRNLVFIFGLIVLGRIFPVIFIVIGALLLLGESSRTAGAILLVSGIIWLTSIKDEYAVRISTNAGETNSLVSKDKSYIQEIVDALNEAIINRG